jgi:hypothetical protein
MPCYIAGLTCTRRCWRWWWPTSQRQNDFVTLPSGVTTVAGPVAPMTVMA